MSPSDLFGVGLRLLALVVLFFGFENLLYYADIRLAWTANIASNHGGNPERYLIYAAFYGLLGGFGVAFADSITRLFYSDNDATQEDLAEPVEPKNNNGN